MIDAGEEYFIAQVTLSEDTEGVWSYSGNVGGQPFQIVGGMIVGGVMRVPEPTTMSLLALGVLAAGRRGRT